MKQIMLIGVVFTISGCVLAVPPTTQFTVHVTDAETGTPLTNAIIRTGFTLKNDPWGTGVGENIRIEEQVNEDGAATFKGNTIGDERGGNVFLVGYYPQGFSLKYKKNLVLNRWEPWNPTIEVKMRGKKKPVPMISQEKRYKVFEVPVYDQPIGYDLETQDFVKPHGKGLRSDLFFEFRRRFENSQNFDVSCKIAFPSEHDGIQECYFDETIQSSFKWPYLAPTNNYKPTMLWRSTRANAKPVKHTFNEKVNYIFRVRTQTDQDGNIVSACYGKIEGPFGVGWADKVNWVYWFNPVPNERSLEYSGENLFKK